MTAFRYPACVQPSASDRHVHSRRRSSSNPKHHSHRTVQLSVAVNRVLMNSDAGLARKSLQALHAEHTAAMLCVCMHASNICDAAAQLLSHAVHMHLLPLLAIAAVAIDVGPSGGAVAGAAALLAGRPRRLRPRARLGL